MRWDRLFDDLESQLEQELGSEDAELAVEEERLRLARLDLRERIVALARIGDPDRDAVVLRTTTGEQLTLDLTAVGRDWLAGETGPAGPRRTVVVPFWALAALRPTPAQLADSLRGDPSSVPDGLSARLGLSFVLRDLSRRRSSVLVVTVDGLLHGTIDRVGRDHIDLAEHDIDQPRRQSLVRGVLLVPLARIDHIRF